MSENTPKVVLIGGPPGAGKSTLGRATAAALGYGYLTVDDLLVAARVLTTEESHPAFHLIGRAGGHLRYFTESRADQLISDSLAVETASWPVVKQVIRMKLMTFMPTVIDWWLLRPATVAALENPQVVPVWLHIDPERLWARERHNTGFVEGSSDPHRMLANFMSRSLWRNELVAREAGELGQPVLHLSGTEQIEDLVTRVIQEQDLEPSS